MKKAGKKKAVKAKAPIKPTKPVKLAKKPVIIAKAAVGAKAVKPTPVKEIKGKEKEALVAKAKSLPLAKNGKGVIPKEGAVLEAKTPGGKKGAHAKGDKKAEIIAEIVAAQKDEGEVVLTNADGKEYCRVHDCDNEATTEGHCRFHYLALWKRNRIKAKILQGGKLDKYIEDLTSKYPDKYLEMLRKDLASEKDFNLVVAEMDVEDAGDDADSEEDTSRFIEEVRGGVPTPDDDEGGF